LEENHAVLTGEHFMNGDVAAAEGGLAAGCRFFAGYPITPATEVAERMSERLPEVGGVYIQMEDEIASMNALLGGAWGGFRTMTSTSGPGFSLMMENIGLGAMLETPCVIVNVQRGGPSTGLPTLVGQADMMQARWGSHGDYEIIALTPNSPQECFDFTVKAHNLADRYRVPVFVMTDESVGHMTEKVVIPPADQIEVVPRRISKKKPGEYLPYEYGEDLVPDMVEAGKGYRIHVTGLTHDKKGYPVINAEAQHANVTRIVNKIRNAADKIVEFEEQQMEDAEVVVLSYGITSRIAQLAVEMGRERGIKVGMLRLIVAWPFPEKKIEELAHKVKGFVVAENNMGQMFYEVQRCAGKGVKTLLSPHCGGDVHLPEQILTQIEETLK
jgi:2-oxoglutarate ferredoxin oxidoreductase subunit alpha